MLPLCNTIGQRDCMIMLSLMWARFEISDGSLLSFHFVGFDSGGAFTTNEWRKYLVTQCSG